MPESHTLFRLRIDSNIVGYMKLYANGRHEFSKDQFWWHGHIIEYAEKDLFSGQHDRNNRSLFEHDVINMRQTTAPSPKLSCLIQFDHDRQSFVLIELTTNDQYELFANDVPLFHKSELTFVGFSFPNHDPVLDE